MEAYGFSGNTFKPAQFNYAIGLWIAENNHYRVTNDNYPSLTWDSGAEIANDFLGNKVSVPATTESGLNILSFANEYAKNTNQTISVNSMARPQAVQEFLKAQPKYYGVAAEKSTHVAGAIDFDVIRNADGTKNKESTDTFIAQLKRKFGDKKVTFHAGHIHVSP